jgi:hypothetical protein
MSGRNTFPFHPSYTIYLNFFPIFPPRKIERPILRLNIVAFRQACDTVLRRLFKQVGPYPIVLGPQATIRIRRVHVKQAGQIISFDPCPLTPSVSPVIASSVAVTPLPVNELVHPKRWHGPPGQLPGGPFL